MSLPIPSTSAQTHSETLQAHLQKIIHDHGNKISFHDYMQIALYEPGLGYYSAGSKKLGEAGDFITAPEISPLFGITLAYSLTPIIEALHHPNWLELGAGSGKLAKSILTYLSEKKMLPEKYFILEVSADLKERQQLYLQQQLSAEIFSRVEWLDRLPKTFNGIIIANEVLDALPVHRFEITEEGVKEVYVCSPSLRAQRGDPGFGFNEASKISKPGSPRCARNDSLDDILATPTSPYLQQRIEALNLPVGYQSEINLQQEALLKSLNDILTQGVMLFIDYGFPAREYYHPDRHQGTLMCHYQHHAHQDPYFWPGLQDITAHVDFTALAKCGIDCGLSLMAYTTQEAWLLHHGITEFAEDTWQASQALRKLISPAEMGELFKFILFGKQLELELPAVSQIDRRYAL